jgi:dienelactone hydrolase
MSIHLLFITDIFGVTQQLDELCGYIADKGLSVTMVSPYPLDTALTTGNQRLIFDNEAIAYDHFIQTSGHNLYIERCKLAITNVAEQAKSTDSALYIIGFSAGASAVWNALDEINDDGHVNTNLADIYFTGFYPSQIRHHTKLKPKGKIQLIFPSHESHFDLADVINQLKNNSQTKCVSTDFFHGFLNDQSTQFNQFAYQGFKNIMMNSELLIAPHKLHHALNSAYTKVRNTH